MPSNPFKDQLRQRYTTLTPALQQVAKYVLDRPNEVITRSMRTVAEAAGAPPSTLVRFAQHFGFDGWPQLKEALTREMGLGPEAYGARARSLQGRGSDQSLVDEIFDVHRGNLEVTQRQSSAGLGRAASLIEKGHAVHVGGFRACFPIAFYFVYVHRLFRREVHLLDGQGGALEMQMRGMSKGDAVLVISFAPYSREALEVAQASKAVGCKLVVLTDSDATPLAALADATLLFSINSPSFFPSVSAGMALTESLLEILASRSGKAGADRLELAEKQLFQSGAYLDLSAARKPTAE